MKIQNRKGNRSANVDCLSRFPLDSPEPDDTEDLPYFLNVLTTQEENLDEVQTDIYLRSEQEKDCKLAPSNTALTDEVSNNTDVSRYFLMKDNVLFRKGRNQGV